MGLFSRKKKKDELDDDGYGRGYGIMYTGDKDSSGNPHGFGVMKYSNGDMYEGRWEHGHRVGGVLTVSGGYRYEGAFDENELFTGHGKYFYPEGDVFEGEYVRGKKEGHGRYEWASGTWSEGTYKDDARNGPTKMYRSDDGLFYDGNMVNNKYEGYLKITTPEGDIIYEGNASGGKAKGNGRLYVNGGYIEGIWDDITNCDGHFYGPDGSVTEVLIRNGKYLKGGF